MQRSLEETRQYFKNDRFAVHSGISIDEVGDGFARCSMKIEDHHKNARDVVMGGAIFTLADFAFAALTNDREKVTVAQQVSINYFAQPKGSRLIATARYKRDGRNSCVVNVDVVDDAGRDIAQFVGTGFKLAQEKAK